MYSSTCSVLLPYSPSVETSMPVCVFANKCLTERESNDLGICSSFVLNLKSVWHSDQLFCKTLCIGCKQKGYK